MSLLVCFSGEIGSGKSSVSIAVGQALGWRRIGFGDYVRATVARTGGDPSSREALQNLGQQLVEADPEGFCRAVLTAGGFAPGENFIIDGIRHLNVFHILERLARPTSAKLLFLRANEAARLDRIYETRADGADFHRAIAHRVEAEVGDTLPEHADAIINADQPFVDAVADCVNVINAWR